jgi:hypothetical protein
MTTFSIFLAFFVSAIPLQRMIAAREIGTAIHNLPFDDVKKFNYF